MSDQLSPGVSFSEPREAPGEIASASTALGGMSGVAERGPVDSPVLIGSFFEYQKIFGGFYLGSPLPYAVKAFFDNGGQSLYVNRNGHYTDVTSRTSLDMVSALLQLQGDGPANTFLLNASSPGAHGNALAVTPTRVDTLVATGAGLAVSAQTSYVVSDIRQLYVGAQVAIKDHMTPTKLLRVIITSIDPVAKRIVFASATPSDVIAAGDVFLEEFSLGVYRGGVLQETIVQLSMSTTAGDRYFLDAINTGDPMRQILVKTNNALALSNTVDPRPATSGTSLPFTTGSDGTTVADADVIGSAAGPTGLYSFDTIEDVNLLAVPGRCTTTIHQGLITYAEGRGFIFAILAVNKGQTPAQAKTYVTTTSNLYSEYASVYYPWVKKTDPVTGLLGTFSPEGDIMGVYARTDATRGVQKAPAGTPDGRLMNVLGPERDLTLTDRNSLYPANINMLCAFPGKGTVVWGSRTLSTSQFQQIPVRRVFNFVKLSLKAGTMWVVFEENSAATRARVRKSVAAFLLRLWRRGVLKGAKASEAFTVVCDESNNPPSVENAGQLICRISLAVSRPAEFVSFELVQDTRALDAELAAAGV